VRLSEARLPAGLGAFEGRAAGADRHRVRLRFHAPVLALAVVAGAVVLALASRDPFWNGDYVNEAWPAYLGLADGGLSGLLAHVPTYAGFTVGVGAPATLLVQHTVGGIDAAGQSLGLVFVLTALPGMAVLVVLASLLGARARAAGAEWQVWGLVVVLAAGPLAYQALLYGHPEDVLAAPLCVLGVLAARRGRPVAAGVALAVAIACKQWAVLAVLPAMLAAERRALLVGVIAGTGAAAVLGPLLLHAPATHAAPLVSSGALFHPHQVWWPFGVPADAAFIAAGHGERMAPAWLVPITHPLIVVLALPLSALWWLRGGRAARDRDDALALLALLFLERCALDPWNLVYYHLPLVLALLAWEVRRGRLPVLALGATSAAWLSFVTYSAHDGNGPFLVYLAWVVPLAARLAWALYAASAERQRSTSVSRTTAGSLRGSRPSAAIR
jgi:Glycosyltransferase family 87